MSDSTAVIIKASGVIDQSRAEALASHLRAAIRNGKTAITMAFAADTVMASPAFLAVILRASELMKKQGGSLTFTGDRSVRSQLGALQFAIAPSADEASSQGSQG